MHNSAQWMSQDNVWTMWAGWVGNQDPAGMDGTYGMVLLKSPPPTTHPPTYHPHRQPSSIIVGNAHWVCRPSQEVGGHYGPCVSTLICVFACVWCRGHLQTTCLRSRLPRSTLRVGNRCVGCVGSVALTHRHIPSEALCMQFRVKYHVSAFLGPPIGQRADRTSMCVATASRHASQLNCRRYRLVSALQSSDWGVLLHHARTVAHWSKDINLATCCKIARPCWGGGRHSACPSLVQQLWRYAKVAINICGAPSQRHNTSIATDGRINSLCLWAIALWYILALQPLFRNAPGSSNSSGNP